MRHRIVNYTPLRYPGGKGKLSPFFKALIERNNLGGCTYVEPFAGGAGLACDLLLTEYVWRIAINDIDRAVVAFWRSVLEHTDEICRRIRNVKLSVATWRRQRAIYASEQDPEPWELGFSFLFLNRTNRSGIMGGGVIGGLDQTGPWKIDARFNREALIERVERIADFRDRIDVSQVDAVELIRKQLTAASPKTLVYLDPPYYYKGQRLYENHYTPEDHARLASLVSTKLKCPWVVSYDDVPEIRALYEAYPPIDYHLMYSARDAKKGREVMFVSPDLTAPDRDPWTRVKV